MMVGGWMDGGVRVDRWWWGGWIDGGVRVDRWWWGGG